MVSVDALFARQELETEWWYYHGHLEAEGRRFAFHNAFFRRRAHDLTVARFIPLRLATEHLWFAHFGLTDLTSRRFLYGQRRAILGGAGAARDHYHVWLGDWHAWGDETHQRLRVAFGDTACDLRFLPRRPAVCHGTNGCRNGDARLPSHWSYTRLEVDGTITLDGRAVPVRGEAWMDRECGRFALGDRLVGWDWFGIQLDDDRELMVYQLRNADGGTDARTHAVVVDAAGKATPIAADEFHLSPRDWWTSPRTGCNYPVSWTLSIPKCGADLTIEPYMRNHELDTLGSTSLIYWEGPAAVRGMWNGRPAAGRCFIELVGYDQHSRHGRFDFSTSNYGLARFLNSEFQRWATRSGVVNTD